VILTIAGAFDPRGPSRPPLERALGPEAEPLVDGGPLIAACAPAPPRARWGGTVCAVDGALHDAGELGAELGLPPDAPQEQVLCAGWARWRSGLLARVRGEFALLLWDEERREGLLARDHFGVRSLALHSSGGRLLFASDVRELLALLASRPVPNRAALGHWLSRTRPPHGSTLYEGITYLEPGHAIHLGPAGTRVERYWAPRYEGVTVMPREELLDAVREGLRRSVARRSTPDRPTGVLMSGGLDSTSVAALAHDVSEQGAYACQASFPDYPLIDESAWMDDLTRHVGLPGVRLTARPRGMVASGLEYLREWSLPLSSWNEAWTQPLLRHARDAGVTAMLSGEGGDELFGSRLLLTADRLRSGRLVGAVRHAHGLPEAGGRAPRPVLRDVMWRFGLQGAAPWWMHAAWQRATRSRQSLPWWLDRGCAELVHASPQERPWQRTRAPRWWAFLSWALSDGVHGFGLLDHVRRRSHQAGLEAHHPLFDLDLFELLMRTEPEIHSEGNLTRPVFREAMAGLSPDSVRLRRGKSVFNELLLEGLTGPELPALRLLLGAPGTEIRAYTRPGAIEELLDRPPPHQRGYEMDWVHGVLRLAAMEAWLRSQADPGAPAALLARPEIPEADYELLETGPGAVAAGGR
jgi:asparagine synthase (glutamine-hydrolysing)